MQDYLQDNLSMLSRRRLTSGTDAASEPLRQHPFPASINWKVALFKVESGEKIAWVPRTLPTSAVEDGIHIPFDPASGGLVGGCL